MGLVSVETLLRVALTTSKALEVVFVIENSNAFLLPNKFFIQSSTVIKSDRSIDIFIIPYINRVYGCLSLNIIGPKRRIIFCCFPDYIDATSKR